MSKDIYQSVRDVYYKQAYKRKDKTIEYHYVWSSKIKKAKHTAATGETLTFKNIYYEPDVQAPGIKTMTKNRIVLDRKKRSLDHFKREIYPKFKAGSLERKHFAKKHGLKS